MESSIPTSAPPPTQYTRQCVSCGRAIDFAANVCPYCGRDYRVPAFAPSKPKSLKPVVGGILIVIAALAALFMGLLVLTIGQADMQGTGTLPEDMTWEDVEAVLGTCGIIVIVFGVIALLGGFFGIMRKHFALAIIGGIFGLLGIGFVIGSVLALVGLILVAMSKDEFD